MNEFNTEALIAMLALVGLVVIIAALFSGVIERSGFPQVAVFLLIGAMLGPAGIGLLNLTLDAPILRIVATLSLVLVLFTDAISLDLGEIRRSSTLTMLVLGPGTLLCAALIALLGWGLLGLVPAAAILLGAALASTDPVLLRTLLRQDDIPAMARQALRLESGLNDVVLLPIVLVAMEFLAHPGMPGAEAWGRLALDLFVLGPGAGILVGVCGVATMVVIRKRIGIRRDYESLYSLGIAFTAYALAESVHGSGFLAAFVAGLTISALDVELCDCFVEYGETTAELTLLFTFVLFGASLIWSGLTQLSVPLIIFAVGALLARPVAFLLSLARTKLTWPERKLIAWFGPRGLSSLLLILLPVFSGIAGSKQLFAICSVVVLLSVIVHGGSPFVLEQRRSRAQNNGVATEEPEAAPPEPILVEAVDDVKSHQTVEPGQNDATPEITTGEVVPEQEERVTARVDGQEDTLRISLDEVRQLQRVGAQVVLLDSRLNRGYYSSDVQAKGAIRLLPDKVGFEARRLDLPRSAWLVVYCA